MPRFDPDRRNPTISILTFLASLLAGNRMPLEIRPLVDYAFKKVFGSPENKAALISFVNAVLHLTRKIVEIEILNPFNEKNFKNDKLSIVDVKATDSVGAIFVIEMQLTVAQGLTKRLVYYACQQVSNQLVEGRRYRELRPVYSICILDSILWKDSGKVHHQFRFTDMESGQVLDETIEIHTLELRKYNQKESDLVNATALDCWLYWLSHAHEYETSRLLSLLPDSAIQQATHVLETIKMKSSELQRYQEREQALRDLGWQVDAALHEGRKIGELTGKIQILQELLDAVATNSDDLAGKPIEELEELLRDLQQRLRNRPQPG